MTIRILSIGIFTVFCALFSCKHEDVVPSSSSGSTNTPSAIQTGSSPCASGTAGTAVAGRYIVLFKGGTADETSHQAFIEKAQNLLSRHGIQKHVLHHVYSGFVKGFVTTLSVDKLEQVRQDREVDRIQQDMFVSLAPFQTAAYTGSTQVIPWGIKRVGAGKATVKTAWTLDTGIDVSHPDLNIDMPRCTSFVCSEPDVQDRNGHGTHVAGIIAAKNNTIGVVGVAAGNKIVAVKVMGADGQGTVSDIIAGLDYIYGNAQAGDVVNMSFSGSTNLSLDEMIRQVASQKNIFFSIAAGNESESADTLSPQQVNLPNVFTISAMDSTDTFASFSNFGNCVDFAAPGVHILSCYLNGQYAYMSGTSMSAPHIAGLLLLNGTPVNHDGYVKDDPDGTPDPIGHL